MDNNIVGIMKEMLDKISKTLGFFDDPHGIKPMLREDLSVVFDQYIQKNDISFEDKFKFISSAMDARKLKNMTDVINKALPNIEENANPKNLDEDWIMDYFDKASKINSDDLKSVWGKILAEEVNKPNCVSRRLLHNLFLMNKNDASNFVTLSRFCFYDWKKNIVHPIVFIKGFQDTYSKYGLTTQALNEMENLFLIELNYDSGFAFKNKIYLRYANHLITLRPNESNDKIPIGNVRLTSDGQALFNMIEKHNNDIILDFTLQELRNVCNVYIQ